MATHCCAKEAVVLSESGGGHDMNPFLLSLTH